MTFLPDKDQVENYKNESQNPLVLGFRISTGLRIILTGFYSILSLFVLISFNSPLL